MALLDDAVKDKYFDVRVSEKNISRGVISAEDFERHISSLPNDEGGADWIRMDSASGSEGSVPGKSEEGANHVGGGHQS